MDIATGGRYKQHGKLGLASDVLQQPDLSLLLALPFGTVYVC